MTQKRNRLKLFIDRALANNFWRQIGILAVLLVQALILSYIFLAFSGSDWRTFCSAKDLSPWLLPIYLLIDTNALNTLYIGGNVHGWMLFACSLTYIIGLFIFNGMIIGIITNAIEIRVDNHRDGHLHYLKSGHYVIMGYDDMVPSIINNIFLDPKNKDADILILSSVGAKIIRERLRKSVARNQMEHIFINYGQRTSKEDYKDIRLEHSKEIFIVGKRDLSAHDAMNVECIENVFEYLKVNKSPDGPKRITCVFEDLDTYAAFKTTEIFQKHLKELNIEFMPYNFYTGWAKQVFVTKSYREKMNVEQTLPYPTIYGNEIGPESDKYVHLVFVGTSNFSVAFAMEAAHLLHFPNFERNNTKRTRITFIDLKADEELKLFSTRNRHFFEVQPYYYLDTTTENSSARTSLTSIIASSFQCKPKTKSNRMTDLLSTDLAQTDFLDVEFEFIKGDVFSRTVQQLIKEWATDKQQYLSLFFAMTEQRKNFMLGMNMPDEVYDSGINIFIRQDKADDFVTSLREADSKNDDGSDKKISYCHVEGDRLVKTTRKGRYAHIYPFGMNDIAYFSDAQSLKRAKLINYLYWNSNNNRFPDKLILNEIPAEQIWQEADNLWKAISVADKWSNLYSAYSISCKLDLLRTMRGLGNDNHSRDLSPLSYDEEDHLAKVEHNRWNVEKLLMGFRKARTSEDRHKHPPFSNDFKDNKKKLYIHSDIRPFKDLDDIRQMDYEIVKYIPWILQMTS